VPVLAHIAIDILRALKHEADGVKCFQLKPRHRENIDGI
jgi:hypothetical protein